MGEPLLREEPLFGSSCSPKTGRYAVAKHVRAFVPNPEPVTALVSSARDICWADIGSFQAKIGT